MRARLRGALRNTWLARSRARRELDGLCWLRERGIPGPVPWLVCERRRLGLLARACLVTEAHPGEPLDELLPRLSRDARDALLVALERQVEALHATGFRHRNLDLRNVLGHPGEAGWQVAVLDAPRYRLRPPGPAFDALARADWVRLASSLASLRLTR